MEPVRKIFKIGTLSSSLALTAKEANQPLFSPNRMFSVYFILFLCNAIVNVILARYFFASLYWQFREGPSHTYGWIAFTSSVILSEIPGAVLVTVVYFVIWYFASGLPLGGEAGYVFLFLLTYEIFQVHCLVPVSQRIAKLLTDIYVGSSRSVYDGSKPGSRRCGKRPRLHSMHMQLVQRNHCPI